MNNEEIQALMSQLKDAGLTPEDIADGILWPLFRDGKMSKEDLSALCASIGLELDEEFDKDTHEDPIDEKGGDDAVAPGVTREEAEEAKEIKPGESQEEFKDKIEESVETPTPAQEEHEADDEEAEWEQAKKLFKL